LFPLLFATINAAVVPDICGTRNISNDPFGSLIGAALKPTMPVGHWANADPQTRTAQRLDSIPARVLRNISVPPFDAGTQAGR
jgi:hypothetical protein